MPKQNVFLQVEIPEGFEPTGEYRLANPDEWFLSRDENPVACQSISGSSVLVIILKKLPQWRDPVLPADAHRKAKFSMEGKEWSGGILKGFVMRNGKPSWICESSLYWPFCQVCEE